MWNLVVRDLLRGAEVTLLNRTGGEVRVDLGPRPVLVRPGRILTIKARDRDEASLISRSVTLRNAVTNSYLFRTNPK